MANNLSFRGPSPILRAALSLRPLWVQQSGLDQFFIEVTVPDAVPLEHSALVTTTTHKRLGNTEYPVPSALYHHVSALVSDFAAEYGEVDLVSRRVECGFDEYEGLLDAFESFGVVGGAGIRIVRDGCVLLVRYEHIDGWIDPGDGRRPGESYVECAKRGVRRATGAEATIEGLAQIQIVYLDDPSDRPPAPNPYVSFSGSLVSDDIAPGEPITALQWAEKVPDELAYDELSELPLAR